jgi:hypothetical protein
MYGFILDFLHVLYQIETLTFGKVLVSFIGANGHQIKEEHDFSSKDRWTDKGGKLKSGTFTSRIL